jgi:hypothetical protein
MGAKARKPPNGSVDQAIKYERRKKITNSRRRTKARNPFVAVAAELPLTSPVWLVGVTASGCLRRPQDDQDPRAIGISGGQLIGKQSLSSATVVADSG